MNTERTLTVSAPVVGVKTTRIYCRPICRSSREPRRENCIPFVDAAAARAAKYRPCKLCRPDDTPIPPPRVRYGVGVTPIGHLFVAATERGICALYILDAADPTPGLDRLRGEILNVEAVPDPSVATEWDPRVMAHLVEGRTADDIPLDLTGTPFQLKVWDALRSIPRGTTTTYGSLARSIGLPAGAARAVGTACGANPVSLIVPCHRVVRAGGGLGGYEWGLHRKKALLEMEEASS
jgi:O-6-methylguanine DNA methyltransferase